MAFCLLKKRSAAINPCRVHPFHGQTGKLFAVVLKGSSVTKISATPIADDPRSPTPWPRGNPRPAVLYRLDDFEKRLDQLIIRLSQLPRPGSARSNLRPLTSGVRLPLPDIVFTVSVTAYVTITTILSVAYLLR